MIISDRRGWRNLGKMHLCTAYCHKTRKIKLLNHCVILFGFRKRKTENFSYQLRSISSFFHHFFQYKGHKKPNLLLLWTMVGGKVCYQALHEFCSVQFELVCHECLRQSGILTSFDGELCTVRDPPPLFPLIMHSSLFEKTQRPFFFFQKQLERSAICFVFQLAN